MASIRKRNGKFQAVVRRSGYKTQTRTFHKKKDALEWAYDMELQADRRGLPDNLKSLDKITLSNLLERYRQDVIPHKKSGKNETIILNAFLKHSICAKPLSEITSDDFEQYKRARLKTVLGSTINRELNIIRHAYNTAINVWEMPISKNPLEVLKKAPEPVSRARRLTEVEQAQIFEQASNVENIYMHQVISFALETAMRRGEILNACYEHINFKQQTLLIPHSKNGHARTIPLSQKAIKILKSDKRIGLIFPITCKALEYHWRNICLRANISDLHFHDLRHEAISRLFERGLSVPEVALISGHRDYRMLFRYTHLKPEDLVRKLHAVG